jgi:hypothetical protein
MYSKHNTEYPSNPWEHPTRNESDPLLNEGFPGMLPGTFNMKLVPGQMVLLIVVRLCDFGLTVHPIPGPKGFRNLRCSDIERDFPRAEEAFLKYIGTSQWLGESINTQANKTLSGVPLSVHPPTNHENKAPDHQHDYEIIVGKMPICQDLLKASP